MNTMPRSRVAASGLRACKAATAAGPPSTSTISNIISTTFRSPITARCSIRRPRTSPPAASRCWLNSVRPSKAARRLRTGSRICAGPSSRKGRGTAAGVDHQDPVIRNAADWLLSIQNKDGGWGEDATSYRLDYKGFEGAPTTASQTAWALLGLMAAGEVGHPAVARGVEYLKSTQTEKGLWDEQRYTATGFPRVFYLRYHGYSKFFPLWALARYRNLRNTNSRMVGVGM